MWQNQKTRVETEQLERLPKEWLTEYCIRWGRFIWTTARLELCSSKTYGDVFFEIESRVLRIRRQQDTVDLDIKSGA